MANTNEKAVITEESVLHSKAKQKQQQQEDSMVQITQTEEDIKIVIALNRLITQKPDVVVLARYFKFNSPPIFFERHLTQDIDEVASYCRIYKKEARIVLIKKVKGIWPEIFQSFSKDELLKKRLEISDLIVERNKERDKLAVERYENKRRTEIEKEMKREGEMRERVKQFQDNACREAFMVGTRKETHAHPNQKCEEAAKHASQPTRPIISRISSTQNAQAQNAAAVAAVRSSAKINVSFSNYNFQTPKRESQEPMQQSFLLHQQQAMAAAAEKQAEEGNKD